MFGIWPFGKPCNRWNRGWVDKIHVGTRCNSRHLEGSAVGTGPINTRCNWTLAIDWGRNTRRHKIYKQSDRPRRNICLSHNCCNRRHWWTVGGTQLGTICKKQRLAHSLVGNSLGDKPRNWYPQNLVQPHTSNNRLRHRGRSASHRPYKYPSRIASRTQNRCGRRIDPSRKRYNHWCCHGRTLHHRGNRPLNCTFLSHRPCKRRSRFHRHNYPRHKHDNHWHCRGQSHWWTLDHVCLWGIPYNRRPHWGLLG